MSKHHQLILQVAQVGTHFYLDFNLNLKLKVLKEYGT